MSMRRRSFLRASSSATSCWTYSGDRLCWRRKISASAAAESVGAATGSLTAHSQYAAVFDLFTDAHINGTQYSWFPSIFYLAYLLAEYPWSYLAQKTQLAKVAGVCIMMWGSVLMLTAASHDFIGMTVCGFLLGVFEAPITTFFVMIVAICTISARRFSVDEKAALIGRARLARTGVISHKIRLYQIWEALLDPQIHLLFLFMLLNATINGCVANFGKLIIKGVVSDPFKTVLLGIPQGAFSVFWILSGTFLASRFKNVNTLVMPLYLVPTVVGVLMMWLMDRKAQAVGVLFGYYLCGSFVASLVLCMQMPAMNIGGYTKRMTGTAAVFLAICVGNIVGLHAFLDEEAPTYATGCKVILGCCAGQLVVAMMLRWLLISRNKQRDAMAEDSVSATAKMGEIDAAVVEVTDQTDFENLKFRYVR
ncbi:major facilitator superfamily domain-containing protein [Zopfochytrium polystomum]|nr:major facilitator superfamily domain-containing protein [Zopfochytrium polystomum]